MSLKAKELYELSQNLTAYPTLIHNIVNEYKDDSKSEMNMIMDKAKDAAEKQKLHFEIDGKLKSENIKELRDLGYKIKFRHRIGFHRNDYTIIDFDCSEE